MLPTPVISFYLLVVEAVLVNMICFYFLKPKKHKRHQCSNLIGVCLKDDKLTYGGGQLFFPFPFLSWWQWIYWLPCICPGSRAAPRNERRFRCLIFFSKCDQPQQKKVQMLINLFIYVKFQCFHWWRWLPLECLLNCACSDSMHSFSPFQLC